MKVGDTKPIAIKPVPKEAEFDATKVTAKSSDEAVAKVGSDGVITAVGVGSTVITYTYNELTVTVSVTVAKAA